MPLCVSNIRLEELRYGQSSATVAEAQSIASELRRLRTYVANVRTHLARVVKDGEEATEILKVMVLRHLSEHELTPDYGSGFFVYCDGREDDLYTCSNLMRRARDAVEAAYPGAVRARVDAMNDLRWGR